MMAKQYKTRYFACDFETTVYDNQDCTAVWSAASVELGTEDVHVQGCIEDFFDYVYSLEEHIILYFHNLKFDGHFIIYSLLNTYRYKQAIGEDGLFLKDTDMPINSFKYSIADRGQWYTITIKNRKNKVIEIRDSLKLLPFSLRVIGKGFGTKHQKLEMEYEGFRYPNCPISDAEMEYIKNDVLVLKEALEIMFADGHKQLTIGACCLKEFKQTLLLPKWDYDHKFPNLYDIPLVQDRYGVDSVGEFCRKAYKGGWCYLKEGCENKVYNIGCTNDVNSLYPSVMHSESGNYYPIGKPTLWYGNYIPEEALINNRFYYIKITCAFRIKPNHLPCIQIKHDKRYTSTEWLKYSGVKWNGEYYDEYLSDEGEVVKNRVTLYLTKPDWELINEQYDLLDLTIHCGMWFETEIGIFDTYINKYREIKMREKGAKRTEAKLFLNNLYGKMATSPENFAKVVYMGDDKILKFAVTEGSPKTAGYIAIGAAITAYARRFTITAAQANYEHFVYADTDSIHCCCEPSEVKGIKVHPSAFCCWKTESTWDEGIFVRQKTYIEHIVAEDLEPITEPYYNVKAAGLPYKSNWLFNKSLIYNRDGILNITEEETTRLQLKDWQIEWIKQKRTLKDFKIGLTVPCSLKPKRVVGGIILKEGNYVMR